MEGSEEQGAERRRSPRHAVQLPIWFSSELMDFSADALFGGEVRDVSEGGLFIHSDYLELPGTQVLLMVSVPDGGTRVELKGRVAWIAEEPPRGPGMGIALPEHDVVMRNLIKRVLPSAEA